MSNAPKAENRPAGAAPGGQNKEPLDAVIGHADGRMFEIPMEVASRYESRDVHDRSEEDEAGGRHRLSCTLRYHSDWKHGPYTWITDGRSYLGWHWHPDAHSPLAYDMDNF